MALVIGQNLIERLNQDDESAFRALYDSLYAKVYRFAYSLTKSRDQADDVVQETFIRLWTNRRDIDAAQSIDAYLFTIARRLVIDMMRSAGSDAALRERLWLRLELEDNTTEETILERNLAEHVAKVVAELPPQQRRVYQLSREQGLTHEEIAEQLQISKNTVKNHIISALRQIRTALDGRGLVSFLIFSFFFFG